MKIFNKILFFLLLQILQLSYVNKFTSICLAKENVVFSIDFSGISKPISDFSEPSYRENHIFEASFLEVVSCRSISFHGGYAELVDSWKVLEGSADLRNNIDALETIEYYAKNVNSNVDELTSSFKSATNKEDWFSGKIAEIRSKARNLPGTSSGSGVAIEGKWMLGTEGNAGLFPQSVADKLKGKNFKNFDEFRSEFWKTVADNPDLANQFKSQNIERMKEGLAPSVRQSQTLGARGSYEIHHKTPIYDGGSVYDMDNMVIVTPRYHKEILDPAYHFNK